MTPYRWTLPAIALSCALTGCLEKPSDAARASYRVVACDVPIPVGQNPANVECGELTVPENWETRSDPTIRLRTVILKSTSADPEPDPFLYLSGGPGSPALTPRVSGLQIFTAEFAAPIQARRDLVFLDLRGAGRSEALDCPEAENATVSSFAEILSEEEERTRGVEAIGVCVERLRAQGVDFAGYTSAQMARDVDVLREHLGYREWNIWGVSYGSRLLQTVLRDRPSHVRAAIVDSGVPLGHDYVTDFGVALRRGIQALSAKCAESARCTGLTPDLAASFASTVATLDQSPALLHPIDSATGQPADVFMTGSRFAFLVQQGMYLTDQLPLVPTVITAAVTPAVRPLLEAVVDVRAISPYAEAQFASVVCQEEYPFVRPEERPDVQSLGPAFAGAETLFGFPFTEALCARVGMASARSIEGEAFYSNVPSLVLHGELDPIAPPEYGQVIAERFSRSHYVEFPGFGHGIVRAKSAEPLPRCAMQLVAAFLDDPLAAPDTSCIQQIPPLAF